MVKPGNGHLFQSFIRGSCGFEALAVSNKKSSTVHSDVLNTPHARVARKVIVFTSKYLYLRNAAFQQRTKAVEMIGLAQPAMSPR